MSKFYKLLFFNTLILGTLIAISSYSWLRIWIGLEINLLSIIPLIKRRQKNIYPAESAIKYFIIQAYGSSIIILSIILSFNLKTLIIENYIFIDKILLNTALLIKIGAAPFHFWLPEVLEGLRWINNIIILTWQKIAPIILLAYNTEAPIFLSIIVIISSIIRGLQGINQVRIRKIIAYSSINHISWIISAIITSIEIWSCYFIIYRIITLNIILIIIKYKIYQINQLANLLRKNKNIKILFICNFLSLGGLPPFLGFFPKWLTINTIINNNIFSLRLFIILFTLITLYFYLRITFSSFTINSEESLIFIFKKIKFFHFFLNLTSLLGLYACNFTFIFF